MEDLADVVNAQIVYGIEVQSNHEQNPFISMTTNAMKAVDAAVVPGAFLVESFPISTFSFTPLYFNDLLDGSALHSHLDSRRSISTCCSRMEESHN